MYYGELEIVNSNTTLRLSGHISILIWFCFHCVEVSGNSKIIES